jgi:probable HAF family extracellular repeat protein
VYDVNDAAGGVHPLGTLAAYVSADRTATSLARDLDDRGRVVGGSQVAAAPTPLAFLWDHGVMTPDLTLAGPSCPACAGGPG